MMAAADWDRHSGPTTLNKSNGWSLSLSCSPSSGLRDFDCANKRRKLHPPFTGKLVHLQVDSYFVAKVASGRLSRRCGDIDRSHVTTTQGELFQ